MTMTRMTMDEVKDAIAEQKLQSYRELFLEQVAPSYPGCTVAETDGEFEVCWTHAKVTGAGKDGVLKLIFHVPKMGFVTAETLQSISKPRRKKSEDGKAMGLQILTFKQAFHKLHRQIARQMVGIDDLNCCHMAYYLPVHLRCLDAAERIYHFEIAGEPSKTTHLLMATKLNLEAPERCPEEEHGNENRPPCRKIGAVCEDNTPSRANIVYSSQDEFIVPRVKTPDGVYDLFLLPFTKVAERLANNDLNMHCLKQYVEKEALGGYKKFAQSKKHRRPKNGFQRIPIAMLWKYFDDLAEMIWQNEQDYQWQSKIIRERQGQKGAMKFRSGDYRDH